MNFGFPAVPLVCANMIGSSAVKTFRVPSVTRSMSSWMSS
jgi:hypothetical protein